MTTVDTSCTVCRHADLKTMVDFGLQPPANKFIAAESAQQQDLFPLALGYCPQCSTMQLTKRMPVDAIRPTFNWLLYNEPEGHLDNAAEDLAKLEGLTSQSRIIGITYKDQSTIDRLAKLGLADGSCIAESDFGFKLDLFGLETVQQLLQNQETIENIKSKYGSADVLLMRHIVEHTNDASRLIHQLRGLIAKNGYLVMELPDSEHLIKACNHAFIWEEHISYFTEESLKVLAKQVGAELAWFKRYRYPYEDSLMVAFRFTSDVKMPQLANDISSTENVLKKFGSEFETAKQTWRTQLASYINKGEKIAVFGAGHLAVKLINFFGLKDLINCVVDDNPNKAGMKMPGSLVPIVPTKELAERGIKVCISTLSPESEIKVRQKFAPYFENGGIFLPAFTVANAS